MTREARAGAQSDEDLVRVPAGSMGTHSAIIAQSGSGKSFFLGRLLEEICLNTRARCIVLDSNADFRVAHQVEAESLWTGAAYDSRARRGRLPHESDRKRFSALWERVPLRIRTGQPPFVKPYEQFQLWWPTVATEFLAEDVEPIFRSDLYHCHAFVRALADLVALKGEGTDDGQDDVLDVAERLLPKARAANADFRMTLRAEFDKRTLERSEARRLARLGYPERVIKVLVGPRIERWLRRAEAAPAYVSREIERFYFGKAREYQAAGILRAKPEEEIGRGPAARFEVIDLPSFQDKNTRLLAINSVIATEWHQARRNWSRALQFSADEDERVPTFIVVDEAHNLIPSKVRGRAESALRDQFRTIVAEGRKYGLFVILASQRPDKLDPLVLSECGNKAVMRLGSGSILALTQKMLGLEDVPPKLLEKCLEFETGRALLVGQWAPAGPQVLFAAARRTVEGGRNLQEAHWAVPEPRRGRPSKSSTGTRGSTVQSSRRGRTPKNR